MKSYLFLPEIGETNDIMFARRYMQNRGKSYLSEKRDMGISVDFNLRTVPLMLLRNSMTGRIVPNPKRLVRSIPRTAFNIIANFLLGLLLFGVLFGALLSLAWVFTQ